MQKSCETIVFVIGKLWSCRPLRYCLEQRDSMFVQQIHKFREALPIARCRNYPARQPAASPAWHVRAASGMEPPRHPCFGPTRYFTWAGKRYGISNPTLTHVGLGSKSVFVVMSTA
jgi:hypothetical protein